MKIMSLFDFYNMQNHFHTLFCMHIWTYISQLRYEIFKYSHQFEVTYEGAGKISHRDPAMSYAFTIKKKKL